MVLIRWDSITPPRSLATTAPLAGDLFGLSARNTQTRQDGLPGLARIAI